MCHALFLGSSRPMPLVSYRDTVWFGVEELAERHEAIRLHFPVGWQVYFLNSHEGCGCGFHSDAQFADDNAGYDQESRRCLAAYVELALQAPGLELALYDCWEGAEAAPIQARAEASPAELEASLDPVPEGTLVTLRPDVSRRRPSD